MQIKETAPKKETYFELGAKDKIAEINKNKNLTYDERMVLLNQFLADKETVKPEIGGVNKSNKELLGRPKLFLRVGLGVAILTSTLLIQSKTETPIHRYEKQKAPPTASAEKQKTLVEEENTKQIEIINTQEETLETEKMPSPEYTENEVNESLLDQGEVIREETEKEKVKEKEPVKEEPNLETFSERTYKIGNSEIRLTQKVFGPGPVFFSMHSDEQTSVRATLPLIEKSGGSLVELHNGNKRNVSVLMNGKTFTFDPNRIFTEQGIRKTLSNLTSGYNNMSHQTQESIVSMVQNFAESVLSDFNINNAKSVIALHNNHEHGLSIDSYLPGGDQAQNTLRVKKSENHDADNFIYVTNERDFSTLAQKGYNVVLHNPNKQVEDGSLITVLVKKGIHYFNPEAQHGQTKTQKEMIADILESLKS